MRWFFLMNTSRMLLMNEIYFLLLNQSSSIEYQTFICVSNMKIWLSIYFTVTRLIDFGLLVHIMYLYVMTMLFFRRYQIPLNDFLINNWFDVHHLDQYSLMIIVLKKEIKLIFVYICIIFLYAWLQLVNSNYRVTYFNFRRWLIEASLLPQVLAVALLPSYLTDLMIFFQMYHIFYVPFVIMKVPLFILLRYAEIQSDFFSEYLPNIVL